MRDPRFTKAEWRQLKELATRAYARELDTALRELKSQFTAWEDGSLTPFDLSHAIHEFHDGIARELWKAYDVRFAVVLVESALERGVLRDDDVPPTVRAKLNVNRELYAEP